MRGIGEDFGFNPVLLRIPLATAVIWNPLIAFGTYFALGALVLASRLLFPNRRNATADASAQPAAVQANDERIGEGLSGGLTRRFRRPR